MTEAGSQNVVRIQPMRGWAKLGLHEVWEYRELLLFLAWREVKARYRQMALGPLWVVLIPLVNMLIFSQIFGRWGKLPSNNVPHAIFYYTALLPWQLFASSATKSATSLVNNINLISKIYFPRMIVPLSTAAVGLFDFIWSLLILIAMMAWYRIAPTAAVVLFPLYLALALATAVAMGLWLASVAVRFRDIGYGVTFIMQAWMFATIIYPSANVPERWRIFYRLNPMQTVIEGARWTLLGRGQAPDLVHLINFGVILALLVTGAYVFRRTERNVVDLL